MQNKIKNTPASQMDEFIEAYIAAQEKAGADNLTYGLQQQAGSLAGSQREVIVSLSVGKGKGYCIGQTPCLPNTDDGKNIVRGGFYIRLLYLKKSVVVDDPVHAI